MSLANWFNRVFFGKYVEWDVYQRDMATLDYVLFMHNTASQSLKNIAKRNKK